VSEHVGHIYYKTLGQHKDFFTLITKFHYIVPKESITLRVTIMSVHLIMVAVIMLYVSGFCTAL
jgi:hypothetical protein